MAWVWNDIIIMVNDKWIIILINDTKDNDQMIIMAIINDNDNDTHNDGKKWNDNAVLMVITVNEWYNSYTNDKHTQCEPIIKLRSKSGQSVPPCRPGSWTHERGPCAN